VAISRKVAWFSTVETGSFGSRAAWFFLRLHGHCICVLSGYHIRVHVVALVLLSVIGRLSSGQVHGDLHIIVCRAWGISGIVGGPLLLLRLPLLLILLGTCSPCPWLELALVLSECVIEWTGVWESCKAPEGLSVRLERFQVMAIVQGAAQGASSWSAIVPREPECVQWSP
jgi:hypothetical protein